jgi:hypothetical protein
VIQDILKGEKGRFFRGNLHCHSNRSDGLLEPEEVLGSYRDAGYDFVCLSDHFEEEYGWRITDNLPLAAADGLPALDAVHAVEVYNHNAAMAAAPDGAHGAYMLEGLLEKGYRVLVNAGDDAHFGHPLDRFGGWVEVHCERLDPEALLDSLKAGRYYSTQGPSLRELILDGERLRVETSEAYAISLTGGGDRWQSAQERTSSGGGEPLLGAEFDLAPFRGSYCRVTVVDPGGRRAWSNPIWP